MTRQQERSPATGRQGRSLLRFARPYAAALCVSAILSVAAAALALVPFWIMVAATEGLVGGTATPGSFMRLALVAVGGVALHYLAFGVSSWLSHVSAYRVLSDMRLDAARTLGRMPLSSVASRRSGGVKTVLIDDIERLEIFLAHGLPDAVAAAVVWCSMTVWMFLVDWRLAIAAIIVVPVAFAAMRFAVKDASGYGRRYGMATIRMNTAIAETIAALPVIASFVRPDRPLTRVADAIRDQSLVSGDLGVRFFTRASAFYVLIAAGGVVVVPAAAWLAIAGLVNWHTVVFFVIVSLGVNAPLVKLFLLTGQLIMLTRSAASVEELLDEREQGNEHAMVPEDHTIVFDDVTFGYEPDTPVLHGISLRFEPGTVTALVGPSGSGKSTIARLLTRIADAPGITIGGVELGRIPVERRGRVVTTVAQEPFLFSGTIADNIRMGRSGADRAAVEQAAATARVLEFAAELPDGIDTLIGERGARLSGGQAQRVAIARTLVADTPVLILDEATAHADPDNEAAIQDALSEVMAGRTLIVIAHRLSTITAADRIVVLDHGRVAETGTHAELLAVGGLYARLWADSDEAAEEDFTTRRSDPDRARATRETGRGQA